MTNVAYVNGEFVAEQDATISIFDRGFLFGDAIYEVVPVIDGRIANRAAHMERLARSLRELRLEAPVPLSDIPPLQDEVVSRNGITEGRVYLQVSRGPAERDFAFPAEPRPTLIMFGRQADVLDNESARNGIKVITVPDTRWARRDIKTVMLLPAALAKQQAQDAGFDDAWMVEDERVTEGSSNNAYIVIDNTIRTQPLSRSILPGCTRRAVLACAAEHGHAVIEEPFSVADAHAAAEAFMTSASGLITPVVQIDEHVLGDGRPGPLTRRLRAIYIEFARASQDE